MENVDEKRGERAGKNNYPIYIISALISLLVSGGVIYYYNERYAPRVVVVDLAEYVADQREGFVSGRITIEQAKANIENIKKEIDNFPKNYVVMTKESVVSGGKIYSFFPEGTKPKTDMAEKGQGNGTTEGK